MCGVANCNSYPKDVFDATLEAKKGKHIEKPNFLL